MGKIAVGDIMTRNFISISPSTNLNQCSKIILKNKLNTLPIINNKKLVGIITTKDILWAVTKKRNIRLEKIKAIDIATRKVAVIKPSADITQAIAKMKSYNFRTLPVISKGELIGIVALKDILRIQPELYQELGELAQIREEARKLRDVNIKRPLEGFCDSCGNFSDLLKVYDKLLCPDCREELF